MTLAERSSISGRTRVDIPALGWALSGTFVVLLVLCALMGVVMPNTPLMREFSTTMSGVQMVIGGLIGSLVVGWVTAIVAGTIYNSLAR